jgi:lipopolysaccharide export system protein LptA
LAEKAVYIPGEIVVNSKDGHATMNDGIYYTEEERVEANNFIGVSGDKKAIGDKVNYFISREVAQLEKNVVVTNPEMKFVGEQLEYSFITEDVYTTEKYTIYYSNYIIDGETLKGNMDKEILDGTNVNMNSSEGEKLYGDFMFANLKNKQIDLDGNVRTLTYNVDEKTGKKEPVKIRGDTAKVFLYDNIEGKLAVSRAEVKKNGIYEYQDMTLYSDYMEIDLIKKMALGRYGTHLNMGGKTDVKSEIADINMNTEVAILTNNVEFENVNEKGEKMTGSSDRGKIYNKENVAVLEDNVVADTVENHIEADYAEYHMETGILEARGNVRLDYK